MRSSTCPIQMSLSIFQTSPYNRNEKGITIHIPQSIIEREELDLSILQFQRILNPKENTTQPFHKQSHYHYKLRTLLLSDDIENVVQGVDLMETVDTSFGEILSIFNLSPDIDSYERMYEKLQNHMEDEECLIYLSLYLSALCQSRNIFDTTSLDLSNTDIQTLPDNFTLFSKLEMLNLLGNHFTSLPESIGNFTLLTKLDLSKISDQTYQKEN